jgi:hypothetical protein
MINEVFFTTREQLSRNASEPWSDYSYTTESNDFESKSGITTRYVKNKGGRLWSNTYTSKSGPSTDADLYGLNDFNTLKGIWEDTGFGRKSFLYIPKPALSYAEGVVTPGGYSLRGPHQNVYLVKADMGPFVLPVGEPFDMEISLDIKEVAPFLSTILGHTLSY